MILRGNLSVRGLYAWDSTLFENFVVPEGVDKDLICTNILAELGELEVLYPDPEYMKEIIGYWSEKQLDKWTKLLSTLELEYAPISNYNRHIVHGSVAGNTTTNKVKAYNEQNNFVDYQQDVGSSSENYTTDITGSNGVYSSQKLVTEELELREKFNIYDLIIKDFKLRFCLLVY